MQVTIKDSIWNEFVKLGKNKADIHRITESALLDHIKKQKAYRDLLALEGKARWEGNLDELRENRI